MNITCIFFGIIFTISGLLFSYGKLHTRLKAWQDMTEEERGNINITPLVRNVGGMISLCGGIFLIKGFGLLEGKYFVIAMVAYLVLAGLDVWYISKAKRYINNSPGGIRK